MATNQRRAAVIPHELTNSTPEHEQHVLTHALLWVGVGAIATAVIGVLTFVLPLLVSSPGPAEGLVLDYQFEFCLPEPLEHARYLVALALAPLSFVLVHALASCALVRAWSARRTLSQLALVLASGVQIWLLSRFVSEWSSSAYFAPQEIVRVAISGALALPIAWLGWRFVAKRQPELSTRGTAEWQVWSITALLTFSQLLAAVQTESSLLFTQVIELYHFPFIVEEFAAALHGRFTWSTSFLCITC